MGRSHRVTRRDSSSFVALWSLGFMANSQVTRMFANLPDVNVALPFSKALSISHCHEHAATRDIR